MKLALMTLLGFFLAAAAVSFVPLREIADAHSKQSLVLTSIKASPGFTSGAADQIIGIPSVNHPTRYAVRYKYIVNNQTYFVESDPTDKAQAQKKYLAGNAEVAYDTRNPAIADLKDQYEIKLRNKSTNAP